MSDRGSRKLLTYSFENVEGTLYEYLYECIKNDILQGKIQSGERLPSKRMFAQNHGISTITIQNAYDQLISEGYIYTIPKKGYYVAEIKGGTNSFQISKNTRNVVVPPKKEKYKIDLSSNQMNPEKFPFSVWAKMGRQIISNESKALMEVSPTGGILELREAIAEHLSSFRNMIVDPNQIIIGAGTEYLYSLLIQLFGANQIYCVENPGYKKLVQIYQQYNIFCKYADMDDSGISIQGLNDANANIAHISPNHHFPTGITMPIHRRYEVLAWANEKEDRYIIEDDYDSEFRINGKPIPTLFSIDACEKVIYMNTFSKSLTPTIRISYMVLPIHLANRFYEKLSFYSCTVSNFEQYTLAAFIKQGYFEKHINRMRLHYSRVRNKIVEYLEESKLKRVCQIVENDSGLHFLLRVDTTMSDQQVSELLKEQGIHIQALSEYFLFGENESEHLFLFNYSNLELEDVEVAFEALYYILFQEKEKPDCLY
ncbi:MAG: PLP-dependent aminotransferase family protein [Candidatus Ruminococcus intestinipullorum]|nr:PLP-dependent aminotransferase family protein [Candidatus Ruminococcus intestinipullorum]